MADTEREMKTHLGFFNAVMERKKVPAIPFFRIEQHPEKIWSLQGRPTGSPRYIRRDSRVGHEGYCRLLGRTRGKVHAAATADATLVMLEWHGSYVPLVVRDHAPSARGFFAVAPQPRFRISARDIEEIVDDLIGSEPWSFSGGLRIS